MPTLPLDEPEPFAAVLGVMLYPGINERDRRQARAFAAEWLVEPIRRAISEGHSPSSGTILQLYLDGGGLAAGISQEVSKRWWAGATVGEIFKAYFALAWSHESLASWKHAIQIAELVASRSGEAGSRTSFREAQREFISVAHLWGAWAVRGGQFSTNPEIGYNEWTDFQMFLAESEILRDWGQNWRQRRAKAEPPLPADVWRVPDDWRPPDRQPSWPNTGMIPYLALADDLLAELRSSGRPAKSA